MYKKNVYDEVGIKEEEGMCEEEEEDDALLSW